IKEASGNLNQVAKLINILPKDFSVYSGDDLLTLPMMSMGAKGVISVTANAYPNLVQTMCNYALNYDFFNAQKLHNYLYKINSSLFLDVNPICIKAYMNLLGYSVGIPRLPLTGASYEIINKLKVIKKEYED
ncbi:MAG: dihydrodipicolinate synthase family protein, partial [Clostridia bacterium]|nr:dihydrodipicolinate synthase family protein [Clostridia bacterium]